MEEFRNALINMQKIEQAPWYETRIAPTTSSGNVQGLAYTVTTPATQSMSYLASKV